MVLGYQPVHSVSWPTKVLSPHNFHMKTVSFILATCQHFTNHLFILEEHKNSSGITVFWSHNMGITYLVFLHFWYLVFSHEFNFRVHYLIYECVLTQRLQYAQQRFVRSSECGVDKARDRQQCTKSS